MKTAKKRRKEAEVPETIVLFTPHSESHRTAEETLALGYLGAILANAGYKVRIIDGWLEGLSAEEIVRKATENYLPSLIGVSAYYYNADQAAEIARRIREKCGYIPAICGGYGPTFQPQLFLEKGFDVAVIGEAESVIVPLIGAILEHGDLESVPNLAFVRNGKMIRTAHQAPVPDLDSISFPLRPTLKETLRQKNFVHVCTARGCEAHCEFCAIFSFAALGSQSLRWRGRNIVNIVQEMKHLNEEYGVAHFKFVDDSFIEPPRDERWAQTFRDELLRWDLNVKFRTQIRADRITPGLVAALKDAGWFGTSLGVENASNTALKRMRKTASQTDNLVALEELEKRGVYVQMGMILFDPNTTVPELEENLRFLKTHAWPVTKGIFSEMYPAQGTPFTKRLSKQGDLSSRSSAQKYGYTIKDYAARRMYEMLRRWHESHSVLYDWVIDPIASPKVFPEDSYPRIHRLYSCMREMDLKFFEEALEQLCFANTLGDAELVDRTIDATQIAYRDIENSIRLIYAENDLLYTGAQNPFLGV